MNEVLLGSEYFASQFGGAPDGLWSAPGRVNLIGEHTDYNDGFAFPIAIDKRTTVAARARADRLLRVTSNSFPGVVEVSLDHLDPDALTGWAAYPLGVAWAMSRAAPGGAFDGASDGAGSFVVSPAGSGVGPRMSGLDLALTSDVPAGAGLSSSAAVECAVALALNDLWELGLDRQELARIGQLAENRVVGAPTGIMDQSASLLGEPDHGILLDCQNLLTETVPLGFAGAGVGLLVIDTRTSHSHADGGYASRRRSCEDGARRLGVGSLRAVSTDDLPRAAAQLDGQTYRRVRHIITENQRVLDTVAALRTSGAAAIGPFLNESHLSMRDDFEISTPELDLAVASAQDLGAIGARMTGGGFGGAAIALVRNDDAGKVAGGIARDFARAGYAAPHIFPVTASEGARREE
ncbi:galactokinase [Arthrobacter sp. ov407]|uniref:galactokinase n=1 Tax=Arthrobacter sp. ov407 TaxID=1761748 RepID=UPI000887B7B0|nr:galactokinase [Arthrobacter sp. ov407]SDL12704.1 galactokinase [Arthrobacter sp. ov407]